MIGGPDHGQQSDTLGHGQRKRGAQFGREKGRHDAPPRASAEQNDAGPMQRPCSGPGEEKAACRLAVQTLVHRIKDRWYALYLVDHHPPVDGGGIKRVMKAIRFCRQHAGHGPRTQVQHEGVGEALLRVR